MKELDPTDPIGQNAIKLISNVCFSLFVFSVLIFTVIAITYQPPDPWESARALTKAFTQVENATFQTDTSVLKTGEDIASSPAPPPLLPVPEPTIQKSEDETPNNNATIQKLSCEDVSAVNCLDPAVLLAIKRFNLRAFRAITFLDYGLPVNGSRPDECDVAWRFRNKKEKSWRRYRDFRRFKIGFTDECQYKVVRPGRWHSGLNARRQRARSASAPPLAVKDNEINDTIPILGPLFRNGKYLYYSRGGDYCKNMNQYIWSFLCALGEARYLNRTLVMDLSLCLASAYTSSRKDEEGKDFRFYFDFEHLKETASIVEEGEFMRDWKKWDKNHKTKIPVKKVGSYKVTPMQLKKEKSTILWRQFQGPEPENYWFRVCEGPAAKYIERPWQALWKSKRLMNIVSAISGSMDWDFDAVHVVRGEKALDKKMWPNLDRDTSPDAIVAKLQGEIAPWRNLYVATNEPFYNYFDKLRSHYKVHLLDDYRYLWGNTSEWYNETRLLNGGQPVEFDGYMRVAVDTEVLYRAKKKVETFYDLTKDCKDGVNKC
ncbi:calcium ion binding [Striga asiatica]|uniref:Calcium ion binding n=1 Tax=Striga asiatica TaxID=4170 RepID=A0A5A7QZ33_STRAF|nr:calcium ion binding [Striga asiatica]